MDDVSTTIEGMATSPALRDLRRLRDLLDRRGALILAAREEDPPVEWAKIAEAAGMTVNGALKSANMEKARREAEGRADDDATPAP